MYVGEEKKHEKSVNRTMPSVDTKNKIIFISHSLSVALILFHY